MIMTGLVCIHITFAPTYTIIYQFIATCQSITFTIIIIMRRHKLHLLKIKLKVTRIQHRNKLNNKIKQSLRNSRNTSLLSFTTPNKNKLTQQNIKIITAQRNRSLLLRNLRIQQQDTKVNLLSIRKIMMTTMTVTMIEMMMTRAMTMIMTMTIRAIRTTITKFIT